jgi:hypothetical protein
MDRNRIIQPIFTQIPLNVLTYFKAPFTALKTGYGVGTHYGYSYDALAPANIGNIGAFGTQNGGEYIANNPAGGGYCLEMRQFGRTSFDGLSCRSSIGIFTNLSGNPPLWEPYRTTYAYECWFNWDAYYPASFDLSPNAPDSPSAVDQWRNNWEMNGQPTTGSGAQFILQHNTAWGQPHLMVRNSPTTFSYTQYPIDVLKTDFLVGGMYNSRWVPLSVHYVCGTKGATEPNYDGTVEIYIDNVRRLNEQQAQTYLWSDTHEFTFNVNNYGNWERSYDSSIYVRNIIASNVRHSGGIPLV